MCDEILNTAKNAENVRARKCSKINIIPFALNLHDMSLHINVVRLVLLRCVHALDLLLFGFFLYQD